MEDIHIVERLESSHYLDENAPNIVFFEVSLLLLMFGNFLEEVAIISVLHDNTTLIKVTNALRKESFKAFIRLTTEKMKLHQ